MKNIFTTVKAAVTAKQAAEYYGLKVSRNGMTCCPFSGPNSMIRMLHFFLSRAALQQPAVFTLSPLSQGILRKTSTVLA